MKKTLAILATVAAVGVTAVAAPAPAEARGRGIGPGLAFGLAAGAITAGAVAASARASHSVWPPARSPQARSRRRNRTAMARDTAIMAVRATTMSRVPTPITVADRTTGIITTAIGSDRETKKPGAMLRAFFVRVLLASTAKATDVRPCGHSPASTRSIPRARA